MEEIGRVFGGIIGAGPQFGERTRERGDEPVPPTANGASSLGLIFLEAQVGGGGGVVIDEADLGLLKGVQNSTVQFNEGAVWPKSAEAGGIEAEAASDFGKKVVAVFIGKIAGADFRLHVPAAEGSGGEGKAADFQAHGGDHG